MTLIIGVIALANILVGIIFFFGAHLFAEAGLIPPDLPDNFLYYVSFLFLAKGVVLFYVLDWKRWAIYAYSAGVALTVAANLSLGSSPRETVSVELLVFFYVAYQAWRSWDCFD